MGTGRNVIIFPASKDEALPKGQGGKDGFFRDRLNVNEIAEIDPDLAATVRSLGSEPEIAFRGEKICYLKHWEHIVPGDVGILRARRAHM